MFVTPAFAQAAAGGGSGPAALLQFVPIVLIFVIMYFLMIRPQQKKVKEHKAMVEALRRGDQVVTSGGLIGKVVKVADAEVELEIAPNLANADKIRLRPMLSWGVRYAASRRVGLEAGVRVPDISDANLLDAQIFAQLRLSSRAVSTAIEGLQGR